MKNLILLLALVFAGTQSYSALQKAPARMLSMPGVVVAYGGATAPDYCVFAYGQVLSRTTYASLFAIYSTTYNTGGEAGTDFRMPDMRGRSVFGDDNMGGSTASRVTNAGSGVVGTTVGAVGGSELLATHAHATVNHVHTIAHTHTVPDHTHDVSGTTSQDFYQGGLTTGASYDQQIGSDEHVHTFSDTSSGASWGSQASATGASSAANSGNPTTLPDTGNAGTGSSANLPPAIILNWCVMI